MIKMTFRGARDLERTLGELSRRTTRKAVVRRVLLAALQPFADRANELAPHREQGGSNDVERRLNHSYFVSTKLNKTHSRQMKRSGKYDVVVHGGSPSPKAVWQEFGTVNHPAQPHARPAWMQTRNQVFNLVARGMRKEVARAVARARKRAARLAARR